ncbi:MAG: BfmA/BtgA family mobilization protein [Bacteroidales bacterium]
MKQVEFINSAIDYFKKTGINPAAEIYTPREEIEMLRKRLEEVIKYLQVHERQKLGPLMERLILLEKNLASTHLKNVFR